jgi:hypothetical protein
MTRTPRLLLLAAATAALVASTAACGSSGSNSATTTTSTTTASGASTATWANSACSAFVTWRATLSSAGKSVSANPTEASVTQAVANAKEATTKLKTTLHGLHTPTGAGAAQAKQELQQLQGQLQNDIVVIQRTIAGAGTTGASQAASLVKAGLATMRQQIAATGKELRSLPSGDVAQAIDNAPACQAL